MNYSADGHGGELWYQVGEDVRCKYKFSDVQTTIRRVQIERIDECKIYRDEMLGRYQKAFENLEGLHTVCETD